CARGDPYYQDSDYFGIDFW
nr:immunoglobulin heavy chain junction region [Macaca mulatta]MOW46702.1 immunoglobulin heavy chain junction region [Macaca mulatta]MOW46848.1 immunoglobulin heavy chain junction region [Macaca mulatta]MOW47108.1 immunoglobulin heavy chain junction region [Macaca mulatta]MOW47767.1 immunoglobulin heavy chain junction region [Macaca mulatta]